VRGLRIGQLRHNTLAPIDGSHSCHLTRSRAQCAIIQISAFRFLPF
jgi:hypothetical protein